MHSTLIVARMHPQSAAEVAQLFGEFDQSDMPGRMGTKRRELFSYNGLYFHLQDFDGEYGGDQIMQARTDSRFIKISDDLKPHIEAYDPATWRSPADAMASRFYHWESRG
jgi:cyclase